MHYSVIALLGALILLIENQDLALNLNRVFELPAFRAYKKFLIAVMVYYIADISHGIFESCMLTHMVIAAMFVCAVTAVAGLFFWVKFTLLYLKNKEETEKDKKGWVFTMSGVIMAAFLTAQVFFPHLPLYSAACIFSTCLLRTLVVSYEKEQSTLNIDSLTGVRNKFAYFEAEKRLNRQIEDNRGPKFAVVVLDVNDLKKVNDTAGHQAGDKYIRDACGIICDTFDHSAVYRVGGDEFTVISQNRDYERIDELIVKMQHHNAEAADSGGIMIACGMAKYDNDTCVDTVFKRADQNMYDNKSSLKHGKKGRINEEITPELLQRAYNSIAEFAEVNDFKNAEIVVDIVSRYTIPRDHIEFFRQVCELIKSENRDELMELLMG